MWQLGLFQNLIIYYCQIFQILTFFTLHNETGRQPIAVNARFSYRIIL